jgi:hypothetical protein
MDTPRKKIWEAARFNEAELLKVFEKGRVGGAKSFSRVYKK